MKSQYVDDTEKGDLLGSFSLAATGKGAGMGATVGSVVPGIGTAIGAGVGAVAGVISSLFGSSHHKLNQQAYANASNDRVTIFWDAEFNGRSRSFPPGSYVWLGKDGRDKISSVKIPKGLKLEVWTGRPPSAPHGRPGDHAGRKAVWTQSKRYIGGSWNDHIDTIRVSRIGGVKNTASGIVNRIKDAVDGDESTPKSSQKQPASSDKSGLLWPIAIGAAVIGVGGLVIGNSKK